MHGNKTAAIPFLETALEKVSLRHKEGVYLETKAPIETYLYLGKAYRITNELDKAFEAFLEYKYALKKKKGDLALVNKELEAIQNAKRQMSNPIKFRKENLGKRINTSFPNVNAVVSGDENTIVYVSKLKFYHGVFMATKENGKWGVPQNITAELLADGEIQTVYISQNGKHLLLARNDNDDYNIYESTYNEQQNSWSQMSKLDRNVNSRYWETHACISPDGNTIFFSSNRPGGFGGLDIYYSQRNEKGEWGNPVNLGKSINTNFDETCPYITENGIELYFSSQGHNTMGGFDIFHSYVISDNFSNPQNIGYPINSTDDDVFFVPFKNGMNAFYSFADPSDGYGEDDIYKLSFDPNENNQMANNKNNFILTFENQNIKDSTLLITQN